MHSRLIKIFAFTFLTFLVFSGFSQDAGIIEMINKGKYQEAADAIRYEGDITKLNVQNLSSLAYCYVMLRDYLNAEDVYLEITSRKKFDDENYMYLGEVQLINEKYNQAKKTFEKFLETNPESFCCPCKNCFL